MEKRHLLLISKDPYLIERITNDAGPAYEIISVKNVHVGYSLALNHLPDLIVLDCLSLAKENLKSLGRFKSSHFLNKSYLFLLTDNKNNLALRAQFKDQVDGIICPDRDSNSILTEIEENIQVKKCLTNYWKDSFMGLFNLLDHPVVLLQDDQIIAINDAFKKDFFVTGKKNLKITDFMLNQNKTKLRQMLRKFLKGKHMKASAKTEFKMNEKVREAKITFSKLDKSLEGQMIMMINFTGKESPLQDQIGTSAAEPVKGFTACNGKELEEQSFTRREKEVISLLCKGYKTKEISELLCISSKTIEKHRANIVKRTRSGTILESIVYALHNNMVEI